MLTSLSGIFDSGDVTWPSLVLELKSHIWSYATENFPGQVIICKDFPAEFSAWWYTRNDFFFMRAWRWRLAETAKVVLHNVSLVLGHKFIVVLQLFGRGRWASITASKSLNASLVSLCFFTKHKNNLALSNTNSGSNTDFLHLDKNPQTYTNRKTNKYRVAIAILLCWQNSSVNSTTTEVLSTSFPGQGPRSGFSSGGANANAQAWAN